MRELLAGLVLASKLRTTYKSYATIYPTMSVNIYAKQIALIYADYTLLQKQVKKCFMGQKKESTILQLSLL